MPVATTLNVAASPGFLVRLAGCVVIAGAWVIVRVAALLVTEPAEFVTVQV